MAVASPKIEKGIVIIAKFGECWDMGFTHLDRIDMQNGTNDKQSGTNAHDFKAKALALNAENYRSYPGYEDTRSVAVPDNILGDMRNTIRAYDERGG